MAALLVRTGFLDHADDFSLRYIFTGEALPLSLIQTLREALPRTAVIPMYGMTECKHVAVMPADRTDKVMAGGECTQEIFSALTAKASFTSADEETELSRSAGIE